MMLLLFYLAFLLLLLGIIWFITGLILLIVSLTKKADIKAAIRAVVISGLMIVGSVFIIYFTDKYLAAREVENPDEKIYIEYFDENTNPEAK